MNIKNQHKVVLGAFAGREWLLAGDVVERLGMDIETARKKLSEMAGARVVDKRLSQDRGENGRALVEYRPAPWAAEFATWNGVATSGDEAAVARGPDSAGNGEQEPGGDKSAPVVPQAQSVDAGAALAERDAEIAKLRHDLINAECAARMMAERVEQLEADRAKQRVLIESLREQIAALQAAPAAAKPPYYIASTYAVEPTRHATLEEAKAEAERLAREFADRAMVVTPVAVVELATVWREAA